MRNHSSESIWNVSLVAVHQLPLQLITTGNPNGPTIMMGERASDLILGKDPLPPSNAPAHYAGDWQNSQRSEAPLRTLARS